MITQFDYIFNKILTLRIKIIILRSYFFMSVLPIDQKINLVLPLF